MSPTKGFLNNNGILDKVNVQNPLPTDGDSIYLKDIDFENSNFTGWVGDPMNLFKKSFGDSLVNNTTDNPKSFTIAFNRPIYLSQILMIESNGGGFSNFKITANTEDPKVLVDDTNKNESKQFSNQVFGDQVATKLIFEFYTDNPISISIISIQKLNGLVVGNSLRNSIPVSSDSVYVCDLDQVTCSSAGFMGGNIADLISFSNKVLVNSSIDNPKTLLIDLLRPIQTNILGIATSQGDFSNVKMSIGFGDVPGYTVIYDGSADDTKRQILIPDIPPVTLSTLLIEFFTADTISINAIGISKSIQTISRIQGQKPDNTITDFQATNQGNFKISLEELENGISVNDNSQLKVSLFDQLGNELVDQGVPAVIVIEQEHHEVHAGKHFMYSDFVTLNLEVSQNYVLVTGNSDTRAHFTFEIGATLSTNVNIYEGGDRTPTTLQNVFNNNRESLITSILTVYKDYTAGTTDGILIHTDGFGTGVASGQGGISKRGNEIILKRNTQYIINVLSNVNANRINVHFDWYDEAHK